MKWTILPFLKANNIPLFVYVCVHDNLFIQIHSFIHLLTFFFEGSNVAQAGLELTMYVAENAFELLIFLLTPPLCWNYGGLTGGLYVWC